MNEGRVFLVGAGPGDPGLFTLRGRQVLESAQAVVYDRLVSPAILEFVPPEAEKWEVGKTPGGPSWSQERINALLVRLSGEGKAVARLKGGDPLVLGRGGEEGGALAAAGIPWEVVPGLTSAIAGPAYAGIPVTQRGIAYSFEVMSAHREAPVDGSPPKFPQLPAPRGQTLIILMGVAQIESWAGKLRELGWDGSTPVALVENATLPEQRVLESTLAAIPEDARSRNWRAPSVAVVGDVVKLRQQTAWVQNLPLWGCRVLVTRPRAQAKATLDMIREWGGEAASLPTLEIAPAPTDELDLAVQKLAHSQWLILTSANAVDALLGHLFRLNQDARQLAGTSLFALGPGTARALERWGLKADAMPPDYRTLAVSEYFAHMDPAEVLLPRSDRGDPELPRQLESYGHRVYETIAYRAIVPDLSDAPWLSSVLEYHWHYLTFTSPSTVDGAISLLGNRTLHHMIEGGTLVAAIGPVTADRAREMGLPVNIVPDRYTGPELVTALRRDWNWRQGWTATSP